MKWHIVLVCCWTLWHYDSAQEFDGPDETNPDNIKSKKLWRPQGNITRDEWVRCRGLPCQKWKERQMKLMKIRLIEREKSKFSDMENVGTDINLPNDMSDIEVQNVEVEEGDELLSDKEIDDMLKQAKKNRHRRKFSKVTNKWTLPIVYKFSGEHSPREVTHIRNAIRHWEENTCVRFKEIKTRAKYKGDYIVITRSGKGCYSWVGKVEKSPQELNLGFDCYAFGSGAAVHEIGHSLGFYHEQQRNERDKYVKINLDNVKGSGSMFRKHATDTRFSVPYDFNSIMHDGPKVSSANGKPTIVPQGKYKYYTLNMGQRLGLSFLDAKMINLAYDCKKNCLQQKLAKKCQRGGYQDPNNCTLCKCPPGFAGFYCEKIAPSKNMFCGGEFDLQGDMVIQSPNAYNFYSDYTECNWYFKAPSGYKIYFELLPTFSVHKTMGKCFHFVEVVHSKNLEYPGPRFCGIAHPGADLIVTEGNELLILFRANFPSSGTATKRGFKAMIGLYKKSILNLTTTPQPTTETPKTTPTTTTETTTRTTTTTTTRPTTTKPEERGQFSFYCDFESGDHTPASCDMVQSKDDKTDWITHKGKTPSSNTGPKEAHSGDYYIYLEASNLKQFDNAIVELPAVDSDGKYCITFWYNMHGFHVYQLNVIKKTEFSRVEIWKRENEQGKAEDWFEGKIDNEMFEIGDKIWFEAVRGMAFSGDIAIDDIDVSSC